MSRNNWETPHELFKRLNNEYEFNIDVAASRANAKCLRFYDEEQDGLEQDWSGNSIWCNPPYRKPGQAIEQWVYKASYIEEGTAVLLLPATTSSKWFHYAHNTGEIHFFKGRVNFIPPPGVEASSNDRDSVLLVFGMTARPGRVRFRDAKTGEYV